MTLVFTQLGLEPVSLHFSIGTVHRHEPQAITKKLRGAALVVMDVRIAMAVNRPPGGRDRRQGDTVRHGAGADRQHPGLCFEQIGKHAVEAAGQGIVSVCPGRAGIGFLQGFENCRSNRRLVVASEIKFHREII